MLVKVIRVKQGRKDMPALNYYSFKPIFMREDALWESSSGCLLLIPVTPWVGQLIKTDIGKTIDKSILINMPK